MSERTLESRLARFRASVMAERRRVRSRWWSARISRWRERLFCFRAEEVRVGSESRRRESWEIRVERWRGEVSGVWGEGGGGGMGGRTRSRRSSSWASILFSSSLGFVAMVEGAENCE